MLFDRKGIAGRTARSRVIAAIATAVLLVGCSYPAVGQPAYEMAVALDQACQLQSHEQLTKAREIIDAQLDAGEMSAADHGFLVEIIATAEQGEWTAARSEIRRLLEDQVEW